MTDYRIGRALCALGAAALLGGCWQSNTAEIQQWMNEVQRTTKVSIEPISKPKKFTPYAYAGRDLVEPFHPDKLEVAFAKAKAASGRDGGVKAPDMDRRRELLEGYPLDTVKMVGALNKKGLVFAVLEIDGNVHHAKIGNYIGMNFGMITHISENAVHIKEVVQDASGEWVERDAKLELQEAQQ